MANIQRGEVDIKLGDKIYTMRPTIQALCEIEAEIGKSIITLLSGLDAKGILVNEQIAIIKSGIKATSSELPNNLDQLIYENGIANNVRIICQFFERALGI